MPISASKTTVAAIAVALIALTWTVFGRAVMLPFINYDDPAYIFEKPEITAGVTMHGVAWSFTHAHVGNWHPLTSLSHMLDCQIFGVTPAGPHAINVALHSISAVLLLLWLVRTTGAFSPSLIVSAIWAVHPLRVESVAWIAERKDVLSGCLFLLLLHAYTWFVQRRTPTRYLLVALLLALGLMAKPILVTAPIVLLLVDVWPLQRCNRATVWQLIREKIPLVAVCIASAIATLIAQRVAMSSVAALPMALRIANAFTSGALYLRDTVWPAKLALFYPLNRVSVAVALIALVDVAAATLFAFRVRRRAPAVLVGWLWFLVMLMPVIGIVQVGLQARADRYTYLPSVGLIAAIVFGTATLLRDRRPLLRGAFIAALLVIAALSVATAKQLTYWTDSERLWRRSLEVTPENATAHAFLADLFLRQDRFDEAAAEAEAALGIDPRNADAENNLGMANYRRGQLVDAAKHFRRSLELNGGNNPNALANYAWLLATAPVDSLRDGAHAVELAEIVVRAADAEHIGLLRTLGAAYAENGRFDDATRAAERALQLAEAQHDERLAHDLRLNLENYRQRLPLRDPGKW